MYENLDGVSSNVVHGNKTGEEDRGGSRVDVELRFRGWDGAAAGAE